MWPTKLPYRLCRQSKPNILHRNSELRKESKANLDSLILTSLHMGYSGQNKVAHYPRHSFSLVNLAKWPKWKSRATVANCIILFPSRHTVWKLDSCPRGSTEKDSIVRSIYHTYFYCILGILYIQILNHLLRDLKSTRSYICLYRRRVNIASELHGVQSSRNELFLFA